MSPAVERVEELLLNAKLTHNGNPVLRWAFANAVLDKDAAGNRKLTKAKSYGKIDPAVASIMALGSFNRETIDTFNVASLIA
jgi:phage terminase large subunit-like protein